MNIKRILVPTDFSESSVEAIKMANQFIDLYGSTIDLIHVIPLLSYYQESIDHLGVPFDMDHDIYPHAMENASEQLHELAKKYIPKEHRGQLINLVGRKISQIIVHRAHSEGHDLIVMSNSGGHGGDHIRSHITEQVIRYSSVPVLTTDLAFDPETLKNILVPFDGSEESMAAIPPAFEMAKSSGAEIRLLHVVEPYVFSLEVIPPVFEDNEEIYHSLMKALEKYLDAHPELNMHIKRTGSDFEDYLVREEEGNTYSVVLNTKVAKNFAAHAEITSQAHAGADLVVMSTHGRTGVARIVLGSTTGVVAQHLEKPLLTVHPS